MLALLLAMGGAWAQGPTQVTQFTTDLLPASWATDDNDITLADLQALGFVAVDENTAMAWGDPQNEISALLFDFNEGDGYLIYILNDHGMYSPGQLSYSKRLFYSEVAGADIKWFYTGAPNQAIELTPDATGKVWTLAETPDYNLDLNVVYYQKFALKEIPANWQVKVDGVDKTAAIDGDSLKITETAQVLLTPDHPERVKKVTLVDEAPAVQTVTIGNVTLDITGCTTWAQIIARNSGVIWEWNSRVRSNEGILSTGGINDWVSTSAPYNPAQQSVYHWEGI